MQFKFQYIYCKGHFGTYAGYFGENPHFQLFNLLGLAMSLGILKLLKGLRQNFMIANFLDKLTIPGTSTDTCFTVFQVTLGETI